MATEILTPPTGPLEETTPIAAAPDEASLFAPVYPFPRLELTQGRGTRVTDREGREYLDFVSGIAVNALGHAPTGLRQAVSRQLARLVHVSNHYATEPAADLARLLVETTGYDRVFLCNSGTEAADMALKVARLHAAAHGLKGHPIVAFEGGFHGRTAFALSATANPKYREPFEPLVPGVTFAPYNDIAALEALFAGLAPAAVIVEPVQGEAGAIPASREFLQLLRQKTKENGSLLIFDEVQCGVGRCGSILAAEAYGVRADITLLAKGLGGGFPIGCVLMTQPAAALLEPGHHGSTFGGNPVAAAAALYVLGTIAKPEFLARIRRKTGKLHRGLETLVGRHRALSEWTGLGLLTAIHVGSDAGFEPADLVKAALAEGLLLCRGGARGVRLLPPLNVTNADLDLALARLDRALFRVTETKGNS